MAILCMLNKRPQDQVLAHGEVGYDSRELSRADCTSFRFRVRHRWRKQYSARWAGRSGNPPLVRIAFEELLLDGDFSYLSMRYI